MDEVGGLPVLKEQESIRLHMAPLANAIRNHAKEWIKCYGQILHDSAKSSLNALKNELEQKSTDLEKMPTTLDELKFILRTISDIKDISLIVETKIRDLQVRVKGGNLFFEEIYIIAKIKTSP